MALNAVFTALFLAVMCLCIEHQLHFFQLNSYKMKVHFKRELENQRPRLIAAAVALLAIPAYFLLPCPWGMAAACAFMLVTLLLSLPKKAKKPLVYTKRVIRLCVTLGIVIVALAALFLCLRGARTYIFIIMAALPVLSLPLTLLANKLNSPVEKAINNGFIKEAREPIEDDRRLTVIGVTGSYGKTSLKFFLGKLLSQKYETLITPESYNTTLGVVRTVRESLRPTHEYFVCEMGARNVGDIKEICDLVSPRHGVITSVGEQHLESFGSIENIIKTKFELADALPEDGLLFVNADSENARKKAAEYKNAVLYGSGEDCAYRYSDVRVSERGSAFTIRFPDGETESFETKLLGAHNVINITGAVACAHSMGVDKKSLVFGVKRLEAVPHRLQLLRTARGVMIDDAYNANPAGAAAALDVLKSFDALRVLVTPGMVELGEKQRQLNFELGQKAASCADLVVLVGEKQTEPILEGLLDKGFDRNNIIVCDELMKGLEEAGRFDAGGRQKVYLLENDLPDNY